MWLFSDQSINRCRPSSPPWRMIRNKNSRTHKEAGINLSSSIPILICNKKYRTGNGEWTIYFYMSVLWTRYACITIRDRKAVGPTEGSLESPVRTRKMLLRRRLHSRYIVHKHLLDDGTDARSSQRVCWIFRLGKLWSIQVLNCVDKRNLPIQGTWVCQNYP